MIALKFARRKQAIFKIHYTTGHFFPKKFLSLVFYDNRDLKISKYKKSEQYFRYKIEFSSASSMNTLLAILKVTDARRDEKCIKFADIFEKVMREMWGTLSF